MPGGVLQAVLGYMHHRRQPTVTIDLSPLNRRGQRRVYAGIARAALSVTDDSRRVVEFTATLGKRTEEQRAIALHKTLRNRFPEVVKPRKPSGNVFEELSNALEALGGTGDRAVLLVRDFEPSAGQDDKFVAWLSSIHYGRAHKSALKNIHLVMCSPSGPVAWKAHPLEKQREKRTRQARRILDAQNRVLWQAELLADQGDTESQAYQRLSEKAERYATVVQAYRDSLSTITATMRQVEIPALTSISLPPSAERIAMVRARARRALGTSAREPEEVYTQLLARAYDALSYSGAYPLPSQEQLRALAQSNGDITATTSRSGWVYRSRSEPETQVRYVFNVSLERLKTRGKDDRILSALDRFISKYGGSYKVYNGKRWSVRHETIVLRPRYALNRAEEQELALAVQPFVRSSQGLLGNEIPAPEGGSFPGIRRSIEPDDKITRRLVERARGLDPTLGALVNEYLYGAWLGGSSPSSVSSAEAVISRLEASPGWKRLLRLPRGRRLP